MTPPTPSPSKSAAVMLIDDSADDLFFIKRLLTRAEIKHPVLTVDGGSEAIVLLRTACLPGAAALVPGIIFCDLKMPVHNGFDVLAWVRSQEALQHVPFYILSGGDMDSDKARAAELGANGYLVKFPPHQELARLIAAACG